MAETTRAAESPADTLAAWREAERQFEGLTPGTADWHAARLKVEYLAGEYQRRIANRVDEARDLGSSPAAETTADVSSPSTEPSIVPRG